MDKCSNARFLMPAKPVMHPFDMAVLSELRTLTLLAGARRQERPLPKLVKAFANKRQQYLGLESMHTSYEYNQTRDYQQGQPPKLICQRSLIQVLSGQTRLLDKKAMYLLTEGIVSTFG